MKTKKYIFILSLIAAACAFDKVDAAVVWQASRNIYEGQSDDAFYWAAWYDSGPTYTKVFSSGGGNLSGSNPNGWWQSFNTGKAIWSPPSGVDTVSYTAQSKAATSSGGAGASALKDTVFNVGRPPRFTTLPPANVVIQRNQVFVIPFQGFDPNGPCNVNATPGNGTIVQIQGSSLSGTTIKGLKGGNSTVTIALNDGVAQAIHTLNVNVLNTAPTIGAIPDMTAQVNISKASDSFNVFDADGDQIALSAASSVQTVVPNANITFDIPVGSSGPRILMVKPTGAGQATITVTATDGQVNTTTTFQLTVTENPPLITSLSPIPFKIVQGQTNHFQIEMISPISVNLEIQSAFTNIIPNVIGDIGFGGFSNFIATPLNTNGTAYDIAVIANTNLGFSSLLINAYGSGLTITNISAQVIPPNTPPILVNNVALSVYKGSLAIIDKGHLSVSDVDNPADELTFELITAPTNGGIFNGSQQVAQWKFSEITNGVISYKHNGNESLSDSFDFNVSDGINQIGSYKFNINVLTNPPVFGGGTVPPGLTNIYIDTNGWVVVGDTNAGISNGLINVDYGITNENFGGFPGVSNLIASNGFAYFFGKYQGLAATEDWTIKGAGFETITIKKAKPKKGANKVVVKFNLAGVKFPIKGLFASNGVLQATKSKGGIKHTLAMALTSNKQFVGFITSESANGQPPSAIFGNIKFYSSKNPWIGAKQFPVSAVENSNQVAAGFVRINKGGNSKTILALNDQKTARSQAFVAQIGHIPIYKSMYQKKGCVWGLWKHQNNAGTNQISGELRWGQSDGTIKQYPVQTGKVK